jgi:hypothetical protein
LPLRPFLRLLFDTIDIRNLMPLSQFEGCGEGKLICARHELREKLPSETTLELCVCVYDGNWKINSRYTTLQPAHASFDAVATSNTQRSTEEREREVKNLVIEIYN